MSDSFLNVFAVAFAFSLLGLALFISLRVLRVLDFTCIASLSLGASSYTAMLLYHVHPAIAVAGAVTLGALAGLITASLSWNLKIKTAVTGIIVSVMSQMFTYKMDFVGHFALDSKAADALPQISGLTSLVMMGIVALIMWALVHRIVTSEYGLAMRIYGDGPLVSESLGIDAGKMLQSGLMISNALVALGGVMVVQATKSFTPDMGTGAFVFGMGSVVFLEKMYPDIDIGKATWTCGCIAFVYKIIIDILAKSLLGNAVGYEQTVYEHIISSIALIILVAFTFNEKNQKHSIFHEN